MTSTINVVPDMVVGAKNAEKNAEASRPKKSLATALPWLLLAAWIPIAAFLVNQVAKESHVNKESLLVSASGNPVHVADNVAMTSGDHLFDLSAQELMGMKKVEGVVVNFTSHAQIGDVVQASFKVVSSFRNMNGTRIVLETSAGHHLIFSKDGPVPAKIHMNGRDFPLLVDAKDTKGRQLSFGSWLEAFDITYWDEKQQKKRGYKRNKK